jgi:hypothetical protein
MFKTLGEYQEHVRKLKEDPDYAQRWKEQREKNIRDYWMELKPFHKAEDVPNLPTMNDFYVNRLIELGAIPKDKLKDGVWYYGNYRNSNLGKWDAQKEKFGLWRHKFGWMWDTCNHFQDDDGFALFVPIRKANKQELEEIKKIEDESIS